MAIESIGVNLPSLILKQEAKKTPAAEFGNLLTDFIGDVNKAQLDSSKATQSFIKGDEIEIHEVMIAGEKAKTSLELLMEIRNKTIDMYRELTRMSV
ncbi:MAG: flagellar hook-basal body complex protein FliE [Ignavibacterium sp.]|jgi:flagellar hook-basal body complex protein FliE|nr:MAG: flagellar hook-basal body complex protein FliE [Ignavibacterium sp.]MDX9711443.1 flagellar hook-basal body complex protein FliE [Ignavibacteriaceae bacterium]MEB2355129.1 flagellar hook-basal body complex protein FliE [Ignavibacteriales bacterium]GIK22533.1 MAG: flagellar hook-basal body complex protein FliE [Ignavibacteriota bacterium]MDD5607393.1 flagellar hook-basal body complex protein FliE [Ignavibacterium sp.]